MDLAAALITVLAGVGMGWINNVAGGAGVFGLLAFEHACGLPFDVANPSTRPGAVGVGLFAWFGYRQHGVTVERRILGLGLWAALGGLVGVLIEEQRSEFAFRSYLAVVLVLLLVQQLRPRRQGTPPRRWPSWAAPAGCFLIGVHMGYVQIGTGLVATLVLQAAYSQDLVAINAAKSVLVIFCSLASVAGFALEPWLHPTRPVVIAWVPALWLLVGTALGSYFASRWAVKSGAEAVRKVVVLVAIASLLDQLWHVVQLLRAG